MRGYFGIGIESGKTPKNLGTLWRSAHAFGASFIFTVGARYPTRRNTDTTKAWRHVPLYEYADLDAFSVGVPLDCCVVGVDCDNGKPRSLTGFSHPERTIYLLGAEDHGLSDDALGMCRALVEIPGASMCLNVATAGSIVLYDRMAKAA